MKNLLLIGIIVFLLFANMLIVSASTTGKFTVTTEAVKEANQSDENNLTGGEPVEQEKSFFEKIFDWFFGFFDEN